MLSAQARASCSESAADPTSLRGFRAHKARVASLKGAVEHLRWVAMPTYRYRPQSKLTETRTAEKKLAIEENACCCKPHYSSPHRLRSAHSIAIEID